MLRFCNIYYPVNTINIKLRSQFPQIKDFVLLRLILFST